MKKSYLLLGLLVSLILLAMTACSSDDELTNTSWKLLGFYSHETDNIEIAQPENSVYFYSNLTACLSPCDEDTKSNRKILKSLYLIEN